MRLRVVCVGAPRPGAVADAIREFEQRAARYWPLEVVEVRDGAWGRLPPDEVREREGAALLARATGMVVAVDERGRGLTSHAFAQFLQARREAAVDCSLVLGGAHGLARAVRERADHVLAIAAWTLSHELARLVLAEQMFRAGTILRGEPYHK